MVSKNDPFLLTAIFITNTINTLLRAIPTCWTMVSELTECLQNTTYTCIGTKQLFQRINLNTRLDKWIYILTTLKLPKMKEYPQNLCREINVLTDCRRNNRKCIKMMDLPDSSLNKNYEWTQWKVGIYDVFLKHDSVGSEDLICKML